MSEADRGSGRGDTIFIILEKNIYTLQQVKAIILLLLLLLYGLAKVKFHVGILLDIVSTS